MRAIGYTRVSSEEQLDGYSLEAQADVVQRLCEFREWQIVAQYEERGRSGKSVIRPEFQTMIADAEAGKFDVIVVHKLDRFSRSLLDVLTYLNRLNKVNVSFVSATEDFDFSTPFGKLILAVLGAFAQWYVDNLAAEVRKGKKQRARSGSWNGTLAFGYTTPERLRRALAELGERYKANEISLEEYERKAGLLETALEKYGHIAPTAAVPCPINAAGVLLAFTLYATGKYSHGQVAWELNRAGYRTSGVYGKNLFSRGTVKAMLQNRFYLGETEYRGERLEGNHEPLISVELFEAVQAWAQERNAARTRYSNASTARNVRAYPLTGLLRCAECGETWIGQHRRNHRYYRDPGRDNGRECTLRPRSAPAARLEHEVQQQLASLKTMLPQDWIARVQQLIEAEPVQAQKTDLERNEALIKALEHRLSRAKQLYMMGDISEGEYKAIRAEVQAQMPENENIEAKPKKAIPVNMASVAMLQDIAGLLRQATPDEQRELYHALLKTVYIRNGQIAAIEPTGVLWTLLNCVIMQEKSPDYPDVICLPPNAYGIIIIEPGTPFSGVQRLLAA